MKPIYQEYSTESQSDSPVAVAQRDIYRLVEHDTSYIHEKMQDNTDELKQHFSVILKVELKQ